MGNNLVILVVTKWAVQLKTSQPPVKWVPGLSWG